MALPGLEQGSGGGGETGSGLHAVSLPSATDTVSGSAVSVSRGSGESKGTKVPSPGPRSSSPAALIRELIKAALEAGAPEHHPAVVQARAWLKDGGR